MGLLGCSGLSEILMTLRHADHEIGFEVLVGSPRYANPELALTKKFEA